MIHDARAAGARVPVRRAVLPLLGVMVVALLALFEREWRHGEIFSPADMVFQYYPWAHDAPRTPAANPTRSDEAFYHQPLMASHFTRLRHGEFPDYDDTRLSGVQSFFNGLDVGRAFSPFSLPYYLLPPEDAVNWYGPLRLLVAALAMWLFLRDLGAGPVAAAAGGVAYGLNGPFLLWLSAPMPTVAAWLPLVLRQIRRCVRRATWPDIAGLALATGALLLGTYLATTLACLFGAAVYAVAELWALRSAKLDGRAGSSTPAPDRAAFGQRALPNALPTASANPPHVHSADDGHDHSADDRRAGTLGAAGLGRSFLALAAGALLGLCVGAVAIWPMLTALQGSPASTRVVSAEGAVWANVATLALPDFWGSPVRGNWWHPDPTANYPEHIAYFGIVVMLLAGLACVVRLSRDVSIVRWTFVALTMIAMTRAYGVAPGRWLVLLPGQSQSNPFRWYALAACGLAVLAGLGLHAWIVETDRRRRAWHLLGPLLVAGSLAAITAAALLTYLPDLRAHNLQAFERAQILRFAVIAASSLVVMGAGAWLADDRQRRLCGLLLVAIAAADLVHAHRGFNPSVPRDRYYPVTNSLQWLHEHASETRIAPVDTAADLVEGHVWGMYGLSTVTGFDFHGDPDYQQFMRLAQRPRGTDVSPQPARWDYVGLRRDTLDLRMLGVLGARYIVTAPLDSTPRSGGYVPIGPMVHGRTLTFTIPVRYDGIRGVDFLVATYARRNRGVWHWSVATDHGEVLARGSTEQASLLDNEWWRLAWTPVHRSAGRSLNVSIRSEGSDEDSSATILATGAPSTLGTTLHIDEVADPRALWFRTFSTAPDRFGEATLVHASDLDIYRNPHARPRAWFARHVNVALPSLHASAMHTQAFDPASDVWLSSAPARPPSATARVTSISLDDDRRTIGVDAPDGGVLVIGDRAHSGWDVAIDGRAVPWQVANSVLISVAVPPGSRTVTMRFRQPFVRPALGLSLLASCGIAFASLRRVRRRRRLPAPHA